MAGTTIAVLIERGQKRCFARALDWPGWCRIGKTEGDALAALDAYAVRYRPVAARARASFPKTFTLHVAEHAAGDATTDFGAPGQRATADHQPLNDKDLTRWIALLRASWATLADVAALSSEELRKGPRGGGRDRTKMLGHVLDAEQSYARYLGVRAKPPAPTDVAAITASRTTICEALRTTSDAKWPARYWIHRAAWHVLDYAWEIEDRQP